MENSKISRLVEKAEGFLLRVNFMLLISPPFFPLYHGGGMSFNVRSRFNVSKTVWSQLLPCVAKSRAINWFYHCFSKEKTRNKQCLEESLSTCTTEVQLLDETERALQRTLTNERLFCNNVSLNVDLHNDDAKMLVNCQPEFFDQAEKCAKPFRDDFQKTTSADRKSDKTCRFVWLQ